uniref:NADH dehydrogenase subunit 6 n=1 Tax=Drieschia cf. elegans BG-2021 TaxID=2839741 RepID=A0A8E7IV18_9ANNE|nr:NADH dehydrogenase subunit 6 [Drieschia cf. elegans BG-2021]
MLLLMSSSLFISFSLSLILCSSPLTMGIWVILLALSISFLASTIFNSWFALIIFLIYIGGMLVMFAYFAALTPNQPLGLTNTFFMLILTVILIMALLLISPLSLSQTFINFSTSPLIPISILYNPTNNLILLILASILFFILVAVVKITNLNMGPLRPFN